MAKKSEARIPSLKFPQGTATILPRVRHRCSLSQTNTSKSSQSLSSFRTARRLVSRRSIFLFWLVQLATHAPCLPVYSLCFYSQIMHLLEQRCTTTIECPATPPVCTCTAQQQCVLVQRCVLISLFIAAALTAQTETVITAKSSDASTRAARPPPALQALAKEHWLVQSLEHSYCSPAPSSRSSGGADGSAYSTTTKL